MDKKNPKITTQALCFNVCIMISIVTFKIFVLGLRLHWVNNNLVDVCAEMMTILLHSHFHQAGTYRETMQKCTECMWKSTCHHNHRNGWAPEKVQ